VQEILEGAAPRPKRGLQAADWLVIAALLAGLFVRSAAFATMDNMLHYDEAYDGLASLSLLHSPRLTPFFPENLGRESGWPYLLTPFIATFGASPFAVRLASVMVGTLTIAAVYALGREVQGKHAAAFSAAALALLYWHMHLSHLALRAILFPLVGTLALAALLRSHRTHRLRHWAACGLALGFLGYTYFAAYLWILFALALIGWWFVRERADRRGILLALTLAALVIAPMVAYAAVHPHDVLNRPSGVSAFNSQEIWRNLQLWAGAWLSKGDTNAEFNLPGRPILDPWLAILFLAGLLGLAAVAEWRRYALWLAGLGLASVLPSVLSTQAPHFLRAIGLTVPIALVAGAGARAVERTLCRIIRTPLAALLPLALLVATGAIAYRDFHVRWLSHPEVFVLMEGHINQAISFIKSSVPRDMPVYFSPFSPTHPVLQFRSADLAPRHVGAFDSHYCQVMSDVPAIYVSLTMYEPEFQAALSRWADVTVLMQSRLPDGSPPRFTVYQALPRPGALQGQAPAIEFGGLLQVRSLETLPASVAPGDALRVRLGIRALQPLQREYSVFVHLYGDPTPYEGGRLWTQGDSWICASYPTTAWSEGETIVQDFALPIPADIPPGRYTVALGVYEAPSGPRLPITAPAPQQWDYYRLQEVQVEGR